MPTKKAKDEAAAAAAAAEKAKAEEVASKEQQAQSQNGQPSEDVNQDPKSTSQHAPGDETWDNDAAVDAAAYQGLVDRLQDRADREFQRIIKVGSACFARYSTWTLADMYSQSSMTRGSQPLSLASK